ncbi:MAG: HD domain-containing phosphohydrolase [Woeseiaceae bacterium]
MNKRVLFVDDEPNVLQAIKRAIRKEVSVTIAVGPEAGLEILSKEPPFAMIFSDMRMPGMSGIEFLKAAQQLSPDSVRVMLTGNSDQQTAVGAVNDGQVFRFLTKPCDVTMLRHVIAQGLRQYELVNSERDLLENTVKGSLSVLTELLAMALPEAFGRTCRIKDQVMALIETQPDMSADDRWSIETATMLSQLCSITMDNAVISKINAGQELDSGEQESYHAATSSVSRLIEKVPRMENVARIVEYQHKTYSGDGFPNNDIRAESIPFGARALHLALAIDRLRLQGKEDDEVHFALRQQRADFDPRLLEQLFDLADVKQEATKSLLSIDQIDIGMRIEQDIKTDYGSLLVCAGQHVTAAIHEHLLRFHEEGKLTGKFEVTIPAGVSIALQQTA